LYFLQINLLIPQKKAAKIGLTGSSPQTINHEQFTANNSPQGRFTAGQFTAEAIHCKAIHRKAIHRKQFTAKNKK
jgi:hypothetical protein